MKPVARISTRGYYNLLNGKTIKNNSYYLYPKQDFKKLIDSKELTIMIHGLRNDNAGAIAKVVLAKNKLKKLGYSYPVIGYSYDSNTTGAHLLKRKGHICFHIKLSHCCAYPQQLHKRCERGFHKIASKQ